MAPVTLLCPLCNHNGCLLKIESQGNLLYQVLRCTSCRSIYCPNHYAQVSPDYICRTATDINIEVIHCQGAHKREAYEQLMKYLNSNRFAINSVLDFGCGTGGFLKFVQSHGLTELYGIDASAAQIEYARTSALSNVRQFTSIREYSQAGIELPDLDLITLWDVIEHIRFPHQVLADIKEFCSPRTLVFFSTPNSEAEYIKYKARTTLSFPHSFSPWEHVLYYSPKGMRSFLENNGFEVLHLASTVCYRRSINLFELFRRVGFFISAHTEWAPQLFVLFRKTQVHD